MKLKKYLIDSKSFILLLALLFTFSPEALFSQETRLDTLMSGLELSKNDSIKYEYLLSLYFHYRHVNIDSSQKYITKALRIAEDQGFNKQKAEAYDCMATLSKMRGDIDIAIDYLNNAIDLAMNRKDTSNLIQYLCNQGVSYSQKMDAPMAIQYMQEALLMAEGFKDTTRMMVICTNIGNIHTNVGNDSLAFKYVQRGVDLGKHVDDPFYAWQPYNFMGLLLEKKGNLEESLKFHEESYSIVKGNNLLDFEARILSDISSTNNKLGYKEKAINVLNEAESILSKIGNFQIQLFRLYERQMNILVDLGKYNQAIQKGNQYIREAKLVSGERYEVHAHEVISDVYEKANRFEKALEHHKTVRILTDSLMTKEKEEFVLETETKYETKKKEVENNLLRTEQAKVKAELKSKNAIISLICIILALLVGLAAILMKAFQAKKRYNNELKIQVAERTQELETSNKELKQSNTELERFAYIASHDLKEPLRNISSFSYLLGQELGTNENPDVQEYLTLISRNAVQMNNLIQDVLEYSRLEDGESTLQNVNISKVVNEVLGALDTVIQEKNASIQLPNNLPIIEAYNSQLFLVFKNLISNGIKYNQSENPTIKIEYSSKQDMHLFSVSDNGIGIPSEYQEQVFEMFKRLHYREQYQGSGLGLAICKKIVHNFGGEVWLDSDYVDGAKFCFTLPITSVSGISSDSKLTARLGA